MVNSEFDPFLSAPKGLPPGPWLALGSVDPQLFSKEFLSQQQATPENAYLVGMFTTALIYLDGQNSDRVSFMPNKYDFAELNRKGIGFKYSQLREVGISNIQQSTGFCPGGFIPERAWLIRRLHWMHDISFDPEEDLGSNALNVENVLRWGSDRNLLPSREIIYDVLNHNTDEIRRIFSIETPRPRKQLTFQDVYRFGAIVLEDHDGHVPTKATMDEEYADHFIGTPTATIKSFWGNVSNFWLEFDKVFDSEILGKQGIINLSVREAIRTDDALFTVTRVKNLRKEGRFFHSDYVYSNFKGGFPAYQEAVEAAYQEYIELRDGLMAQGVSEDVCKLACQNFDTKNGFKGWIKRNADALIEISSDNFSAEYIRRHIQSGLDLLDEGRYRSQIWSINRAMVRLGLTKQNQRKFIFDLIPRVKADEVLAAA